MAWARARDRPEPRLSWARRSGRRFRGWPRTRAARPRGGPWASSLRSGPGSAADRRWPSPRPCRRRARDLDAVGPAQIVVRAEAQRSVGTPSGVTWPLSSTIRAVAPSRSCTAFPAMRRTRAPRASPPIDPPSASQVPAPPVGTKRNGTMDRASFAPTIAVAEGAGGVATVAAGGRAVTAGGGPLHPTRTSRAGVKRRMRRPTRIVRGSPRRGPSDLHGLAAVLQLPQHRRPLRGQPRLPRVPPRGRARFGHEGDPGFTVGEPEELRFSIPSALTPPG